MPLGGRMGLMDALAHLGLEPVGQMHRAVDDARNAAQVLRYLERQGSR